MTVTGIIAEYNPFHNGHQYQLQNAKKDTNADYVIVVMSGDFTQRGTPAIIDKFSRARMALENGADLVLELPSIYATGSAEYFAKGAVSLLNRLHVVDHIAFGSESGQLDTLSQIADILSEEPPRFKESLSNHLKSGLNYPQARIRALEELYPDSQDFITVLSTPNNILGIEYLKALKYFHSDMTPHTTLRVGSDYHDKRLSSNFSSAISIRQSIESKCGLYMIQNQVPKNVYHILSDELNHTYPISVDDFSSMLQYKLISERMSGFRDYYDITPDLSDRILNHLDQYTGFSDFSFLLKTKDMTYTRICRCLLHVLLDMRQQEVETCSLQGFSSYAKVLGFRKKASKLLSEMISSSEIPVITRVCDLPEDFEATARLQFDQDIKASHLYEAVVAGKFNIPICNEYKRRLLTIET